MAVFVARRAARRYARATRARSLPAGVLFGLSYVCLFEAYYRGLVTVVSPLVATESLWGVALSAVVLGTSERVGPRLVAGAALVVVRRRPDRHLPLASFARSRRGAARSARARREAPRALARRRAGAAGT